MLTIKTTGVDDYLDGSANIKALVIGGPGAGKTRMSSYWPKPIFLDCENGRGSLADRNMPYVDIKTSRDMLDALEYLKSLERTAKASRQFQTVVVDTADSFQRLVKDEWMVQTKSGAFSGYDAWGYLDAKMQLLFTRLLNLDYNVVVLSHYKDKTFKDGDNTVRELTLQLQGAISDQIFNDFGLVGWLGTYWEAGEQGRVQKRGLTFQPTPDKPFLKDRFNATPTWMEITFADSDYQQLWEAFYDRPEFEALQDSSTVGEIPDHRTAQAPTNAATEGGPLPAREPAKPPEQSLDKMLKGELETKAKELGVTVRGNMLKAELIEAIKKAQDKPAEKPAAPDPTEGPSTSAPSSPSDKPAESATASTASATQSEPAAETTDPWAPPGPAEGKDDSPTSTESSTEQQPPVAEVAQKLGGEVISTEQPKETKRSGPSVCADCGKDLAPEWGDPAKRNQVRMSFARFRTYTCSDCYSVRAA